jgi:hypothetical protein
MQFADPRQRANAYLILRHLYDGDVIEWPIEDDHPLKAIFDALEQQGYVARWDRVWPLHDRYRLTETGIAAIEAVYKPSGADAVWSDLRGRNMRVKERRVYLVDHGYDPYLWPLLHDPSTSWDTYYEDPGFYWGYIWEDDTPYRTRHYVESVEEVVPDVEDVPVQAPYVVDLDREAAQSPEMAVASPVSDYDVS